MSSVCLSLVATLRCAGLDPSQNIGILVPPFAEAIFAATLIYTQYDVGRKHWFLVLDSWVYLILCIIDFASKANNSIALNLNAFATADRVVGAFSGVPILFYTIFLFLLARRNLVTALPASYNWVTKALLISFIPLIFVLTELGSLLGIGYAVNPVTSPFGNINPFAGSLSMAPSTTEITVKFFSVSAKTVWTFLNSTSLAFLLIYQFFNFLLAAIRLTRYFMGQHANARVATQNGIGGLGYIAVGIKLGAIETLLGFIPNGFEMALARRLIRMLGRSILVYGVAKGIGGDKDKRTALFRVGSIDSIEGLPPRRIPIGGNLRDRIGRPLTGTFAKLSPTAAGFYGKGGYPYAYYGTDEKLPLPPPLTVRNATTPSTAQTPYHDPRFRPERVTVMWDGKLAPVLDIRFSELQFGDPTALIKKMEEAKYRPSPLSRAKTESPGLTQTRLGQPGSTSPLPFSKYTTPVRELENPFADSTEGLTLPPSLVTHTDETDSFNGLRQISNRFPPTPGNRPPMINPYTGLPLQRSRTLPDEEMSVVESRYEPQSFDNPPRSSSLRSSGKRKPAPIASPTASEVRPPSIKSAGVVTGEGENGFEAAERTRRRLRTHFAQLANADDGARVETKTQDGMYPPAIVVNHRKRSASVASDSFLPMSGGEDEQDDESEVNPSPSYAEPIFREKPVGRLANRALGIEKVLDEEKSRKSTDGSRPGTGQDANVIPLVIEEAKKSGTPRTPRKPWVEDEEDAREAFAAAWRTVVPTPSPTVSSLKNVNSVTARKTATVTVPAETPPAETGMIGSADTEDRAFLRKSRLSRRASMDSDVY